VEALSKSIEGLSNLSAASPNQNVLPKTANFLSQLEQMMTQVKREAAALEGMKGRLKEIDEIKQKYSETKQRLADKENEAQDLRKRLRDMEQNNNELREDFQKLNDIYSSDRKKLSDVQQQLQRSEQEVAGMKLQNEFLNTEAQKIPELKKAIKHLKKEVNQVRSASEEEKNVIIGRMHESEKCLQQSEKSKSELSQHIWQLTEEINGFKQLTDAERGKWKQKLVEKDKALSVFQLTFERKGMLFEDWLVQKQRYLKKWNDVRMSLEEQSEARAIAERRLLGKEVESEELQQKLANARSEQDESLLGLQQKVMQSADHLRDLQQRNHQLEKELISYRSKCSSLSDEHESMLQEMKRLRQSTEGDLSERQTRDLENASMIRQLTQERDEITYQLQSITALHEGFQQQTKLDQKKLWEEIKTLKDNEAELLDEADKLSQELQEKTVQLHQLEAEKLSKENAFRAETDDVSGFLSTLRDELEKRVSELVIVRQERDMLHAAVDEKELTIEEMHSELARLDAMFKRTMNEERSKFKTELTQKTSRLKQLEAEKQELLSETQELMLQQTEAQRVAAQMRTLGDEHKSKYQEALDQVDLMRARLNEASSEIKRLQNSEEQWIEKSKKNEARVQEEMNKLELQAREMRKSGSQQVLDLSKQLKIAFDDCEELRRQIASMTEQQQRVEQEKERLRSDLNKQNTSFQDDRDSFEREIQTLKRDVQEHRNKCKQVSEIKTRMELELISLRMESGKQETEVSKMQDRHKAQENEMNSLLEKQRQTQLQLETVTQQKTQLVGRITDLETTLQTKDRAIDTLHADLQQLERDGLTEIRRLRLLASSAEQENTELKLLKEQYEREAAEARQQHQRQQSQTSLMVSSLREELRQVEETLAKEKRIKTNDIEELRRVLRESEKEKDKIRHELEEVQHKQRSERVEREQRMDSLSEETERLRGALRDRELAVEELEAHLQTQRRRYAELQDRLDKNEQDTLNEHLTRLDAEMKERKKAEVKLRTLQTQCESLGEQLQEVTQQLQLTHQQQQQQQQLQLSQQRTVSRSGSLFAVKVQATAAQLNLDLEGDPSENLSVNPISGSNPHGNGSVMFSTDGYDDFHDNNLQNSGLGPFSSRSFQSQQLQQQQNVFPTYRNSINAGGSTNNLLLPPMVDRHPTNVNGMTVPPLNNQQMNNTGLQPLSMPSLSARFHSNAGNSSFGLNNSNNNSSSSMQSNSINPDSRVGLSTPSRHMHTSNNTNMNVSIDSSTSNSTNTNSLLQGSPAVDRVSMALAFKLAQQQRSQPPPPTLGLKPSIVSSTSADDGDNVASTVPEYVGISGKVVRGIHALDFTSHTNQIVNNPKALGTNGFGAFGSNLCSEEATANTTQSHNLHNSTAGNNSNNDAMFSGTGGGEVEETIRRAQDALRRRATGFTSKAAVPITTSTPVPNSNTTTTTTGTGTGTAADASSQKTPNSGRRLKETLQHAQSLYSGNPNSNTENSSSNTAVEPLQLDLAIPSPRIPALGHHQMNNPVSKYPYHRNNQMDNEDVEDPFRFQYDVDCLYEEDNSLDEGDGDEENAKEQSHALNLRFAIAVSDSTKADATKKKKKKKSSTTSTAGAGGVSGKKSAALFDTFPKICK
jgi:predicted  nucleic acid-binding Zn-ribbon protein